MKCKLHGRKYCMKCLTATVEDMKWVKITEGCAMPDYDHPVLWLCENGNMHVESLDKDGNPWLFPDEDPDTEWGDTGSKATHWRELPEPPLTTPNPEGTIKTMEI